MKTGLAKTMLAFALLMGSALPVLGAESEVLTDLVQNFLSNSLIKSVHEQFWSDDLVYTSSNGTRFGKTDILAGLEQAEAQDAAPVFSYSGEEIDVRVYGDMAVVAFKLIRTPTDKSSDADVVYYFNTGTFRKREGVWQAVAWQATEIPPEQ